MFMMDQEVLGFEYISVTLVLMHIMFRTGNRGVRVSNLQCTQNYVHTLSH